MSFLFLFLLAVGFFLFIIYLVVFHLYCFGFFFCFIYLFFFLIVCYFFLSSRGMKVNSYKLYFLFLYFSTPKSNTTRYYLIFYPPTFPPQKFVILKNAQFLFRMSSPQVERNPLLSGICGEATSQKVIFLGKDFCTHLVTHILT